MSRPVYKLLDGKGRVLIPVDLRQAARIGYGDIVRLEFTGAAVSVKKVEIIEVGDQSPEAVEAYVRAAFRTMKDEKRLELIGDLSSLIQRKEN